MGRMRRTLSACAKVPTNVDRLGQLLSGNSRCRDSAKMFNASSLGWERRNETNVSDSLAAILNR
ncbi:hypothetical protein AGABI2DRAFT_195371 [Agaricus bisporus var. bisporus H97]|uniref:hypothetical protein n=1 Tax=Agaricus bisporus var. bisporus (strain H97 / ATCC MYA-4626 / FGSC 10389) TaxID=936046 RepID=UPI00029F5C10|nr:hypothetical protein AGABI2DRAFT_195371 [Agaricus bisporus var. bisporus H97]EKV43141.1 hypothetical protein AGABI2DRAFT_195371 [Agaricus bisporus var. bisporus H97]